MQPAKPFEASKNAGVGKIIFASSGGAVYGEQDVFPAPEEHPTRPASPYGVSKRAFIIHGFHRCIMSAMLCAAQRGT